MKQYCSLFVLVTIVCSCGPARFVQRSAMQTIINDKALVMAHVGISIYSPDEKRYLYNFQGEKYFVPASNVKIATCYAAMKYLGDSLAGLRYEKQSDYVNITGTGDPTFLHPDFKNQPVFEFLKKSVHVNYPADGFNPLFSPLGKGWAWDDYLEDDAAERSEMPIYGNVVRFYMHGDTTAVIPSFFYNSSIQWHNGILKNGVGPWFKIVRPFENNVFHALSSPTMYQAGIKFSSQAVPFKTIHPDDCFQNDDRFQNQVLIKLLEDTLHHKIGSWIHADAKPLLPNIIHSHPTDSVLKPMMHRSDNFFAEQSLLMVSNELLGVMNDERIIDTLLKTDFRSLPQKPRWVDGSGLSRYNLFTPQDFVYVLDRMQQEFGMDRIKEIFPGGNEGTLKNYFTADSSFVFAKTGTLSGIVALSGYLYTRKNKLLIFSVLVNNHQASSSEVRRAIERFILLLRGKNG